MDPQQYAATPASALLDAAQQGFIGVDQRLIHALVDHPERTLPDILRFAESGELEWDLVNIFRYLKPPEAVPYLVGLLRNYRDDPPPDLTETLIEFGSLALDPMLALYGELDEEESSEVAFVLAGLGVRDPRILSILLERLEYDAADTAISLSLYADPTAVPRLEAVLSQVPEDDTYLRQELTNAIRDIRDQDGRETAAHPPFDIFESYPEEAGPDFDLLDEAGRLSMLAPGIPAAIRAEAASSFRNDTLSSAMRSRLQEAARTDPDANVRGRAWEALSSFADEPALRQALIRARYAPLEERTGAVVALAEGPEVDDNALDVVEPLYQEPAARSKALEAMWKSLDRRYASYFPQHLEDPDPAVRRQAILGAGYLELSSQAPKLLQMFNDDEFRHDALLAYALCAPLEVTPGRMKPFFRKIDQLAGLSSAEAELVEEALNQRLAMHGLEPVFGDDEDDEPEPAAPPKQKVGRNDPCPCGSGKKYKKCCGA